MIRLVGAAVLAVLVALPVATAVQLSLTPVTGAPVAVWAGVPVAYGLTFVILDVFYGGSE